MAAASLPTTFQAAQYSAYGEKTVKLVELPMPVPKAGEVLVKVEAASINPIDWKLQTGTLHMFVPLKLPIVPSMDLSGVVCAVGEGVTQFSVGDPVVSSTAPPVQGALAEYAIATVAGTSKRPSGVSANDGASIPIAALTAMISMKQAGVTFDGNYKGRILILNASGGVGTFAVQIARLSGGHVVATCGARNIDLVKSLGADEVLDYRSEAVVNLEFGGSFDFILCATHVTNLGKLMAALKSDGSLAMLDAGAALFFQTFLHKFNLFTKKKMVIFILTSKVTADMDVILEWMQQGKVKAIIDSTFPLTSANEAWTKSIDGHAIGKIVVTVP
eukprot:TRINITY_DN7252_c0_g1_i1.p1 TRINITY_DN7252_c0_g1~~TRINITY_DN7252_c0_g1_i1.p1  ORF type:complete len:331 (+),score=61.85 TRINITY_DN7252_c0_g1_i1:40-1032(+)